MNLRQIKNYAQTAHRDFVSAVENRLLRLGLTEELLQQRSFCQLAEKEYTAAVLLAEHLENRSYQELIEIYAYLFFNQSYKKQLDDAFF